MNQIKIKIGIKQTSQTKISPTNEYETPKYVFDFFLKSALTILGKRALLWLDPHLERFTPSTKLKPPYFLANAQPLPIRFFRKTFNPPKKTKKPTHTPGWGVETMDEILNEEYLKFLEFCKS